MLNCAKSRNRDSFIRLKSESPKFKDALRKKCHQRWRENRWSFIDKTRNISEDEDVQRTLANIIKEDLLSVYNSTVGIRKDNLDENLQDLEQLEGELSDDRLKWLMDEYEKILDNDDKLADLLEELNHVICPICKKDTFVMKTTRPTSFVTCGCGIEIPTVFNLSEIKDNINQCVNTHNVNCDRDPHFEIICEYNNECHIYLICYICSNFSLLL